MKPLRIYFIFLVKTLLALLLMGHLKSATFLKLMVISLRKLK